MFAHGTTITIGGTAIGGLTNIGLPEQTRDSVDITDQDSGGDMEFLAGLRDGGSIQIEGRKIAGNTGQAACRTNYEAASEDATEEFVITLPGGAGAPTFTFDGHVTGLGGAAPHNDKVSFTATVKVSGAVVEGVVAP